MSLFRFPFGTSKSVQGVHRILGRREKRRALRRNTTADSVRRLGPEQLEVRAMLAANITEVTSAIPLAAVYGIGQQLPFQVVFDDPVAVL